MPKRPCPFEESLSPLMKVHIGEKEVECGVMRRDKMKAVYDRTLNLLYCGAKNVTNNNAVEKMDTSPTKQMNNSSCPNLHQMVLTSSGTLVRSLPTSQRVTPQPDTPSSCVSCGAVSSVPRPPCTYCECKLCDSCMRSCHFCGGNFCPKCSLTVYLQEEKNVCLSCC
ncbi:apoptosis regulatory protein Siva-like [Homarus americanus]|uniref:apoptosis regulatory protein Siva-like n=1 Tax=Homarus americanus TaxID=6706 RepID=UPI001C488DD8|nr:apoptosis regulatory protein Siva-like [Homarus americanus]